MTIVRQTSSERRAIVEGVWFTAFGELNLPPEGVDLPPPLEDGLLLAGKINGHDGRAGKGRGGDREEICRLAIFQRGIRGVDLSPIEGCAQAAESF